MARSTVNDIGLFAGRLLLSHIFLISGLRKVFAWSATAGYMASKGMPAVNFLLPMAIILEIAGGLSLLVGWQSRIGALLLVVFLLPTTLIFHNFWALAGADRGLQTIQFMKNLAVLGGLLVAGCAEPGAISLDGRRSVT